MRRVLLLLACLSLAAPVLADRLPERAAQVVDYHIAVKLDTVRKTLDGHEQLTWKNPSGDTVSELWFHLYLNAFKNAQSTFIRESGGQLRGDRMTEGKWGWIEVTSMRVAGGADLRPQARFEHPDDDNAADQTVLRVPLAQPVPPGGTIALDIAFKAQLPQVFARSGYAGDYFLVGQWFPKIAVYEPAGMRGRKAGGWNCHQYHATSEFYADFGHYLVDITVPSRFVIGATGERRAAHENKDGTSTYTYEQSDVHDFAWTVDPRFMEVHAKFSARNDVTPAEYAAVSRLLDRPLDEVRLSDVDITLLLQPYHRPQLERHISAIKAGIKYYGLWYGRYPYRTLTVVDPGLGGSGSEGMEYPTFITAGTSYLANGGPFKDTVGPEMVTVHEFGHQFWYGMEANNEFEEAWLDEGINSYSTGRVMETAFAVYGSQQLPGFRLSERDTLRFLNSPNQKFGVILQPAWTYESSADYAFFSYMKPELVLRTLENYLGRQTMARVMRTFQERWRFRHPSTDDFVAVVNEVAGQDMSWYLNAAIRTSQILDYEVSEVSSVPDGTRAGGKNLMQRSRVVVRRRGDMVMPVEIALKFEGQPIERVRWNGVDRFVRYDFIRPQRLLSANVDPDRKFELDVDWLNNGRRTASDARVATKWSASLMFFVQALLAWIGA
jgi:hypothetical protein